MRGVWTPDGVRKRPFLFDGALDGGASRLPRGTGRRGLHAGSRWRVGAASWVIRRAHNECIDAIIPLHGLAVCWGNREDVCMAPRCSLGQMIFALPLSVTGNVKRQCDSPAHWRRVS